MFEDPGKICIITDLDGTFLPRSKKPLPQDLAAVRRFEAAGGLFTIATGRTVQASRRYPEELGLKSPMIVFNGAGIYDAAAEKLVFIRGIKCVGGIYHIIVNDLPAVRRIPRDRITRAVLHTVSVVAFLKETFFNVVDRQLLRRSEVDVRHQYLQFNVTALFIGFIVSVVMCRSIFIAQVDEYFFFERAVYAVAALIFAGNIPDV